MTTIAIEEHWTTGDLDAALRGLPAERRDPSLALNDLGDTAERLTDLDESRLSTMAATGIDMQVLSLVPPGTGPLEAADAVARSRGANDFAAEVVSRHPDSFRFLATLPMSSPAAAADELQRAAGLGGRGLGAVGAMVYGRTGERQLDDRQYDEVFAVAEAARLPIFVHPQLPPPATRIAQYSGFAAGVELALSSFAWGWHVEAGTAVLRMIAAGVFDRHPGLQIIVGHWGELLLFWRDRFQGIARMAGLQRSVDEVIRENLHITCSGMLDPAMLQHALAITTIDRVLFSTDYPFQRPTRGEIERFLTAFSSDEDREAFVGGNAMRLFGISESA
jgi:predicted TIM-barrel fold metal-dependent hydrolase